MNTLSHLQRWFDSDAAEVSTENPYAFNWVRCIPFIWVHLMCLGAFYVGVSAFAVGFCIAFFWLRMFAITAFYHRYFAHRSFKTSRGWQFVFAVLGNMSAQRGPLWWAAHHRHHHQHSDQEKDLHSPAQRGFWWSHVGWFTCDASFKTQYHRIKDFNVYPELRFINRYDLLVPVATGLSIYGLGELLAIYAPQLQTNGLQLIIWGFFISTVLLFHSTVTINSLAHCWGKRRFNTKDNSRNNWFLALLTLGEGWHNNHHRWPRSAKQGFFWWEIDITYYILKGMAALGIVRDLNPVPAKIYAECAANETNNGAKQS
ncbi:MAG: acyl-CoA desaturase [Pseudomonadales bacterium]|nr:acyl-CoA desaturase [Pseudomonadales bacterium]